LRLRNLATKHAIGARGADATKSAHDAGSAQRAEIQITVEPRSFAAFAEE